MKHLAIFRPAVIDEILSGGKRAESRFTRINIPPFGFVSAGDTVVMKQSGGKIIGQFTVLRVISFDRPSPAEFALIRQHWQQALGIGDKFFSDNADCRYVTIMFIESATRFLFPPNIPKHDQRAWVVLG